MLRSRIIPTLLVRRNGLVKTRKFGADKYVGDPLNAVRIFNEKEADELIVLDIDATADGREPNYVMIENLAAECRMPLCYGGGVQSVEQARRILGLGVEKVAVSAAFVRRPEVVAEMAEQVGSQSVVVVLDVKKKTFGGYRVYIENGRLDAKTDPLSLARLAERHGAGEIVLNSIDRDGEMEGYDLSLAKQVRAATNLPLTVMGGAGSFDHILAASSELGTVGVAAGSLFVFKGQFRAVLISYPSPSERLALLA